MTLQQVSYVELEFGPYTGPAGDPTYKGLNGWIRPSTRVTHTVTGEVIAEKASRFTIDNNGYAKVRVPHTDNPILNPYGFLYSVGWDGRYGSAPLSLKGFALPQFLGSKVKYNLLKESEVPGVLVAPPPPVIVEVPTIQAAPTFTFRQETPATIWNITHPLNRMAISAVVYSLDYSVEWEGFDTQPLTNNTCRLAFDDPTSGIALIY